MLIKLVTKQIIILVIFYSDKSSTRNKVSLANCQRLLQSSYKTNSSQSNSGNANQLMIWENEKNLNQPWIMEVHSSHADCNSHLKLQFFNI